MKTYRLVVAILTASMFASVASATQYSYIVGLDPGGDNWLALRSEPSGSIGVRLKKMGPETLLTVIDHHGEWTEVRTTTGEIGWVSSKYIACCRESGVSSKDIGDPNSNVAMIKRVVRPHEPGMQLSKTVVVSGWALQVWQDENVGGEALVRYDLARGWVFVESSGGAYDVSLLVARGVPRGVAEQLVAGIG